MKKTMAIVQELMTPTTHWVITSGEAGAITFTDAEGRSMRFMPNNKSERHQLTAGTIETKTKWDNRQLHQEISIAGDMKVVRILSVRPESMQLTVTVTMDRSRSGPGPTASGQFVYDVDAER